MEVILAYLQPYFDDPAALRVVFIVLAGIVFAVLGLGISYLFFGAVDPMRRRLGAVASEGLTNADPEKRKGMFLTIDTFLGPVSQYVLPREALERSVTQERLTHAGFREPNAMQLFYAAKAVLIIGLPLLVFFGAQFFPDLTNRQVMFSVIAAAAIGMLAPSMVVDRYYNKRQKLLRDGFPDALDLLVVCVEAGLGLSQALQRVADELAVSHLELSQELSIVNAEVRAGVDRVEALKNLSARTGLDDIKGLVSLLVQTLRFGTGVADSLRVYSEEFRDKRTQRAEEIAAKIGTKLIFPLVFFMFPGFFVVAVGPAAIRFIDAFSKI